MKKLIVGALTGAAALLMTASPVSAGHAHFVIIDNPSTGTRTCQYVGSGQTSISDADHGGYHRIHDNVHTGRPGTDDHGTAFDKHVNLAQSNCDVTRGAPAP